MKAEQTMNAFHRQLNARKKKLGTKTEEKLGKVRNWVAVATRPERVGPAFGSFQRFRHRRHRKKKKKRNRIQRNNLGRSCWFNLIYSCPCRVCSPISSLPSFSFGRLVCVAWTTVWRAARKDEKEEELEEQKKQNETDEKVDKDRPASDSPFLLRLYRVFVFNQTPPGLSFRIRETANQTKSNVVFGSFVGPRKNGRSNRFID